MIFIKKIFIKKDYTPFVSGESFEFSDVNLLVGDQGAGKSTLLHLLNNAKNKNILQKKVNELFSTDIDVRNKAMKTFNPAFMQDKGQATFDEGNGLGLKSSNFFDEYDNIIDVSHSDDFNSNLYFLDTEAHNPRIKYSEYDSKRPMLQELSLICREIHKAVQNQKDKEYVKEIFREYVDKANAQKEDIDGFIINSHKSHGETILPMLSKLAELKNFVLLLDEPETSLSVRSQFKLIKIINEIASNGNQLFVATHSPILMESQGRVLSLEHREWMKSGEFLQTQKS